MNYFIHSVGTVLSVSSLLLSLPCLPTSFGRGFVMFLLLCLAANDKQPISQTAKRKFWNECEEREKIFEQAQVSQYNFSFFKKNEKFHGNVYKLDGIVACLQKQTAKIIDEQEFFFMFVMDTIACGV